MAHYVFDVRLIEPEEEERLEHEITGVVPIGGL